jgi:hypothetical protein
MKDMPMKYLRLLVGFEISALCIWFSLRQVKDWHAFFMSFRQIELWVMIPTFITYSFVMLSRAWRWDYIMKSQVPVKFSSSLIGLIIGYMTNNILPFRAGEFMRAVIVARRENKSFSPVLASVVVERIFDGISVLLMLAVVLIWVKFPAEQAQLAQVLRKGGVGALVVAMGLMVVLYILYLYREPVVALTGKVLKPFGSKLQEFSTRELDKFSQGLTILGKPSRMIAVMLQSILVWVVNMAPIWLVAYGFGIRLSPIGTLLLLCLGGFSAAIPAAPGFWGVFHYITSKGIVFLTATSPEKALSIAIVLHAFYYFPTIIVGLLLLWGEGYSFSDIEKQAEKTG